MERRAPNALIDNISYTIEHELRLEMSFVPSVPEAPSVQPADDTPRNMWALAKSGHVQKALNSATITPHTIRSCHAYATSNSFTNLCWVGCAPVAFRAPPFAGLGGWGARGICQVLMRTSSKPFLKCCTIQSLM